VGFAKVQVNRSRAYTTHSSYECSSNPINSSDQHQVVRDEYDKVEEKQEETNEIEVKKGEESEASYVVPNRRRYLTKEYLAYTIEEEKATLDYNPTSDSEQE
jgi:hypothetical protein